MEIFHWLPNGLGETLEFRTEIKRTRTTERRVSYVDGIQRQNLSFTVEPSVAEEIIGLYLSNPNQTFLVPNWPVATFSVSATLTAADTDIAVEDEVVFAVGQKVIIGQGEEWEEAEVDAVGTNEITLTSGLVGTYAASPQAPYFIAPLVEAICPRGPQATKLVNYRRVNMEFLTLATADIGDDPYTQFDDRPFVDDGYLVTGEPDANDRASILVDSGFGAFQIVETETFTRRSGSLSWISDTYADRLRVRRFIQAMRGRDGEMFVSSEEADLLLNSGFSSGTIAIDVQPAQPAADMVGQVLRIQEAGNSVLRTVTGATDNSATSQTLSIAAPGFAGTTAAKISFVTKSRFDTDTFDLGYVFIKAGMIATVSAPVIEVP